GLSDLRARHLGAGAKGIEPGRSGAADDLGSRGLLRHSRPWPPAAGTRRRPRDLRPGDGGLRRPPRAALRPARRREAHDDALERDRVHRGERRAHVGTRRAYRRFSGPSAALLTSLLTYLSAQGISFHIARYIASASRTSASYSAG